MSRHPDKKIYTPRHWLFYAGIFSAVGATVGMAAVTFDWSNGLAFAIGVVACTITSVMALREDLFGPVPTQHEQRDRRA